MITIETWNDPGIEALCAPPAERPPELVIIPVSDIDRAKRFYGGLGWRLDMDTTLAHDYRVVQLTPPGSDWSVMFGKHLTAAEPGSLQRLHLTVSDIEEARRLLLRRGAQDLGSDQDSQPGSDTSFSDPDGNGWVFHAAATRKN